MTASQSAPTSQRPASGSTPPPATAEALDRVRHVSTRIMRAVAIRIIGQEDIVSCLTAGFVLGGNVLLEGVPGVGKTLLAKTLADAVQLRFARIQFTPDLMPADILGTYLVSVVDGQPQLSLQKGPLFSNVILADEINRASPKTQSALLEAMQERQITLGTDTYPLDQPFFVVATQNPIDNEGTYPLPEAQLDRFLMKLCVPFPSEEEVLKIVAQTTSPEETQVEPVADGPTLLQARRTLLQLPVADFVAKYAVRVVFATHPEHASAPAAVKRYVRGGASPRAAQSIIQVAKFFALMDGRANVAIEDIQQAARPCLRHRFLLNLDALADDATTDTLVTQILNEVPTPKSSGATRGQNGRRSAESR